MVARTRRTLASAIARAARASCSGILASALLLQTLAYAGPMLYELEFTRSDGTRFKVPTPARWPRGSTINVYIRPDPFGKGRDRLLKEGVERWISRMKPRGITIKVKIANPPAGAKNVVDFQWRADGRIDERHVLGPGPNEESAVTEAVANFPNTPGGMGQIESAIVYVRRRLPLRASRPDDKVFIRNLAEHEMVHVFGFRDEPNGSVSRHRQSSRNRTLNAIDKRELNSLYPLASRAEARGRPSLLEVDPALRVFKYRFAFEPGGAAPPSQEHVSVIVLDIEPELVASIQGPPGWITIATRAPIRPDHPFFAESMADVITRPSFFDPGVNAPIVALQTSVEQAIRDGLGADADPALSLQIPTIDVVVRTRGPVLMGSITVWAGGSRQSVPGPVPTPAPATAFLCLVASGLLTGVARRLKRIAVAASRRPNPCASAIRIAACDQLGKVRRGPLQATAGRDRAHRGTAPVEAFWVRASGSA